MPSLRHNLVLPVLAASMVLAAPASAATSSSWERVTVAHTNAASMKAEAACEHADTRPGDASEGALAKSTVCLLNRQRARRGLRKLRLNWRLSKAAQSHTVDMVKRSYFSHVSKSGTDVVDRLNRTGYMRGARSWTVGENLAWGAGTRSTPREIVQAWMNSHGHRANILQRRFREVGIGVVFATPRRSSVSAGRAAVTFTTTFGARS